MGTPNSTLQNGGGEHLTTIHGWAAYIAMTIALKGPSAARLPAGQMGQEEGLPLIVASSFHLHPALLGVAKTTVATLAAKARQSGEHSVIALLDEGSQITLFTKAAASRIGLGPEMLWQLCLLVSSTGRSQARYTRSD